MTTTSRLALCFRVLAILGAAAAMAACDRAMTEPRSPERSVTKSHHDLSDTLNCRGGWVVIAGIVYCG